MGLTGLNIDTINQMLIGNTQMVTKIIEMTTTVTTTVTTTKMLALDLTVLPDPGDGRGEYVEIRLSNDRGVAWVSPEDAQAVLNAGPWFIKPASSGKTNYAVHTVRRPDGGWTKQKLHRFIMAAPKDLLVDHINFNGLDCRRGNMQLLNHRESTIHQRPRGASRFTGVCWHKNNGMWQVRIREKTPGKTRGKRLSLGCFTTEEAAALAYDTAALEYHEPHYWMLNCIAHPELIDWADAHGVEVDPRLRALAPAVPDFALAA